MKTKQHNLADSENDASNLSPEQVDAKKKKNDVTGQTDTTLKEMKARLKEVPHTSAATKHDKDQYEKKKKK